MVDIADPKVLIDAAMLRNKELTDAAIKAGRDVMTAASGRIIPPGGFVATVPELRSAPPPFSPNSDLSIDFTNAYKQAFNDFTPTVLAAVADYLARFFPGAIAAVCDDWIQNTIVNGGTGIPADIERAIWDRARGREMVEATRLEQEALNQFAARGFSMPPGALAYRMMEVQQGATNKSATLSRDIAIKNVEIEIGNIKFAIEQGLRVRLAVISGIGDYIRAWMKPADDAVAYAQALVNAKEKLWNAASDYYRAMIAEAAMKLDAQRITQGSRDAMIKYDIESFLQFTGGQIGAAQTISNVIASAAAGALNAAGVMAETTKTLIGAATA